MLFGGDKGSNQRNNANKIVDYLNGQNADIICLQDVQLGRNNAFNAANAVKELESIKHYHFGRSSVTYGVVTFTRYPILKMGEIRTKKSSNIAIYTDVLIDSDTVRIFNIHLQSYKIDPKKYSIIESPGIADQNDLKEVREIGSKLKRGFQYRAEQVREISDFVEKTPYPVIICGDFNDTPVSYAYQQILGNRNDAFVNAGRGFGRTYIGKLPSFRIDNIFYSDHFKAYNFKTANFRMSDHLPVSCRLIKK
jgi:endonuclease/exonuclease/phosphatase family metal-dependent hydrolase